MNERINEKKKRPSKRARKMEKFHSRAMAGEGLHKIPMVNIQGADGRSVRTGQVMW